MQAQIQSLPGTMAEAGEWNRFLWMQGYVCLGTCVVTQSLPLAMQSVYTCDTWFCLLTVQYTPYSQSPFSRGLGDRLYLSPPASSKAPLRLLPVQHSICETYLDTYPGWHWAMTEDMEINEKSALTVRGAWGDRLPHRQACSGGTLAES